MDLIQCMNTLNQMDYSIMISLIFDKDVKAYDQLLLLYDIVSKWYDVGCIVEVALFDFA